MRTYSLLFTNDASGEVERIDFEARDPSAAFDLAERHGHEREMQLFDGDMLLGTIQQMGGFWKLTPSARAA